MKKEDFINTKWDARNWSEEMKTEWQEKMFKLGFKWRFTGKKPSYLDAGFYFISNAYLAFEPADAIDYFNSLENQPMLYSDAFPEPEESETKESEFDVVKKPKHYDVVPHIEAKEIIKLVLNSELAEKLTPYQAYCLGNTLKYRLRAGKKDDIEQEINKAAQYVKMGWEE